MVRTVIPFIERRRHRRFDATGRSCAVTGSDTWATLTHLTLRDVSGGGLAAYSPVRLDIRQAVTVALANESPGQIRCRGRVVRCSPVGAIGYEVAVAFEQFTPNAG